MTELEIYKEQYNAESDYIEKPTKALASQWLDAKIEEMEHLNRIYEQQGYDLAWGDLDDDRGDYEYTIEVCGFSPVYSKQFHVYSGINKLAEILGAGLSEAQRNDGIYEYSFGYKGYRVFQISEVRHGKFAGCEDVREMEMTESKLKPN